MTGGRYDHLLEKFGKQTPSIGFAIIIDELQNALSRQKITVETGHNNLIVGDAIVTGGRYDHLLEKFGKQTPSIGFAIIIDELQNALSRQKITVETGHNNLIVYTDATEKWAIALAKDFREKGKYMELLKRTEEDSKETFIAYGKRTHAVSMLYLNENLTIDMVNLSTGEEKKVNARKKAKARENR